jgi:hypothetical protein
LHRSSEYKREHVSVTPLVRPRHQLPQANITC